MAKALKTHLAQDGVTVVRAGEEIEGSEDYVKELQRLGVADGGPDVPRAQVISGEDPETGRQAKGPVRPVTLSDVAGGLPGSDPQLHEAATLEQTRQNEATLDPAAKATTSPSFPEAGGAETSDVALSQANEAAKDERERTATTAEAASPSRRSSRAK